MAVTALFGGFFVISALFGAWELYRWREPFYAATIDSSQKTRRMIGIVLLLVVTGMLYHGAGFPTRGLSQAQIAREMLYWGICMLTALALPVVAYIELKYSLLKNSAERKRAYRETILADTAADEPDPLTDEPHDG